MVLSYGFYLMMKKKKNLRITYTNSIGSSLMGQWLGLCTFTGKGPGFSPWSGD